MERIRLLQWNNSNQKTGKDYFTDSAEIRYILQFGKKHKVVTLNGNTLLLTITGNLIEKKKYPT